MADTKEFLGGDGREVGTGARGGTFDDLAGDAAERAWRARAKLDPADVEDGDDVVVRQSRDGTATVYRPGQVVVARADLERVRPHWEKVDGREVDERGDERGTVLVQLPGRIDVLAFVDRVRRATDGPAPELGPNHVLAVQPYYRWGPGGEPEPDTGDVTCTGCAGEGVTIGVLDTGMWREWPRHHQLLDHRVERGDATESSPLDLDPLVDGGPLVRDAGHGTFIAGIIAQRAPGARMDHEATLDELGFVDEYQLGLDLPDVAEAHILSMSFGGFSHRNRPPVELSRLIDAIPPDVAIVAAAGNQGTKRPMWPAAFSRVIGVAAVGRDLRPPSFTNRGSWVDACTYGVLERSTYVLGEYPRTDGTVATFKEPVARWSGTSFAAPRLAAAIADVMAAKGHKSARTAAADLLSSGKPMGGGLGVFVP